MSPSATSPPPRKMNVEGSGVVLTNSWCATSSPFRGGCDVKMRTWAANAFLCSGGVVVYQVCAAVIQEAAPTSQVIWLLPADRSFQMACWISRSLCTSEVRLYCVVSQAAIRYRPNAVVSRFTPPTLVKAQFVVFPYFTLDRSATVLSMY